MKQNQQAMPEKGTGQNFPPAYAETGAPDTLLFSGERKYRNLPLVVIAGRPNVGKSTLFNRFLHTRRTITDPTPGVTRDIIEEDAFLCGKPVRLVDTGGFKLDHGASGAEKARNRAQRASGLADEAEMDALVVAKTKEALARADRIVLLLEAGNITPEDEEFIALLRPYWDKVIGAVNKTEGGRGEAEAWNFLALGFRRLLLISAEHGDNIPELAEEIVSSLDFSAVEEDSEEKRIKIAVVGKPNTGKSTLVNLLTGKPLSIVSDVAGTTRDVVEGSFVFRDQEFQVLDTAGIRRKSRVTENVEYYSVNRAIKTLRNADLVFHMIDAEEGLTEQDKKIAAHACEAGVGVIFILNKWDTVPGGKKAFPEAKKRINVMFARMEYAPVLPFSALRGDGVQELLQTALSLYGQLSRRVETSALNLALEDWVQEYPPPQRPGSRFKLRYMVQVQTNPVKFLLFATNPHAVSAQYLSYLTNRLRRDFGFSAIPLLLEVKGSRRERERAK